MDAFQLSLWDNVALETGYRQLAALELEQAIQAFDEALKTDMGEAEAIRHSAATACFWHQRLSQPAASGSEEKAVFLAEWVDAFGGYSFTPKMQAFEKRLVSHFADHLLLNEKMDVGLGERIFDLLLARTQYEKAGEVVSALRNSHPGMAGPVFMDIQVKWRSGQHAAAARQSAEAILAEPDHPALCRIEDPALRDLLDKHGAPKTPAYGWIAGILPLLRLPEAPPARDAEHARAIEAYRALQSAHSCLKAGDQPGCLQFRKALKTLDPELFRAYFLLISRSA